MQASHQLCGVIMDIRNGKRFTTKARRRGEGGNCGITEYTERKRRGNRLDIRRDARRSSEYNPGWTGEVADRLHFLPSLFLTAHPKNLCSLRTFSGVLSRAKVMSRICPQISQIGTDFGDAERRLPGPPESVKICEICGRIHSACPLGCGPLPRSVFRGESLVGGNRV